MVVVRDHLDIVLVVVVMIKLMVSVMVGRVVCIRVHVSIEALRVVGEDKVMILFAVSLARH